jgi:hypothetical protein
MIVRYHQIRLMTAAMVLAVTNGCTERIRIATPPVELMTCADEPAAPQLPARDGTDATQLARDVAMLNGYLALRTAYGSCRAAVEGVAAWSRQVKP